MITQRRYHPAIYVRDCDEIGDGKFAPVPPWTRDAEQLDRAMQFRLADFEDERTRCPARFRFLCDRLRARIAREADRTTAHAAGKAKRPGVSMERWVDL